MLLLIAVANTANILPADTVRRDAEMAIRASLGASWLRLTWQMVTETLLVTAVALGVALVVPSWAITALVKTVPYVRVSRSRKTPICLRALQERDQSITLWLEFAPPKHARTVRKRYQAGGNRLNDQRRTEVHRGLQSRQMLDGRFRSADPTNPQRTRNQFAERTDRQNWRVGRVRRHRWQR